MLQEFREFIQRGNVVDLAVAVVIGAAFTAIISSLVDDIIMPLIGILLGGIDPSSLSFTVADATVAYGNFLQAIINFLLISFVLFLIVRTMNKYQRSQAEEIAKEEEEAQPSAEVQLLTEIRDLLEESGK